MGIGHGLQLKGLEGRMLGMVLPPLKVLKN